MPKILRVSAEIEVSDDIAAAAKVLELAGPFLDGIKKLGGDTDWSFEDQAPKRVYKKREALKSVRPSVLREMKADDAA